jgi:hypothetical protein
MLDDLSDTAVPTADGPAPAEPAHHEPAPHEPETAVATAPPSGLPERILPPHPPAWRPADRQAVPPAGWSESLRGSGDLLITTQVPPGGGGGRKLAGIVAVLLAAALIAGGVVFVRNRDDNKVTFPKAWDTRVVDIAHFVEQNRGSSFVHPVAVDFLTPAQFKKHVGDSGGALSKEDKKQLEQATAALRAVGLLSGKVDLASAGKKLAEESIIGLYDPTAKKVWVRGAEMTPDVRVTLAHELTHALQDQRFDLRKIQKDSDHDTSIRSLIEADAMRIEDKYIDTLSDADRKTYDDAQSKTQGDADLSGIPDVLTHSLQFPYVFGPAFIDSLVAEGGTSAIDSAFARPPKTEAEILNPRLYLDRVALSDPPVPKPVKGEKRLDEPSPFGQEAMTEVLAPAVGFDQAWQTLQGWRGDSSSVFEEKGGRICVAVSTRFDNAADAAAFKSVVDQWAAQVKGSDSLGGTTVGLRGCDPGASAPARPKADPDPFEVLSARSAVIRELLKQPNVKVQVALCTADGTLKRLGAKTMAEVPSMAEGDPRVAQVFAAVQQAASACIGRT